MKRVEEKLAIWHRLHQELSSAETRLQSGSGPAAASLQDEVKRLQRESDQAMEDVHRALASRKQPRMSAFGKAAVGNARH